MRGAIYGFAGEYGTGKSLMAMQIAAYAAAEGHKVAYLYTEGQFSEPIFLRIAARAARELNVPEDVLQENVEVYEIVNSFALQQLLIRLPSAVNVVIVDSIIEPFRAERQGAAAAAPARSALRHKPAEALVRCVRHAGSSHKPGHGRARGVYDGGEEDGRQKHPSPHGGLHLLHA
jgi:RecA/RadA recombinase